LRSSCSAISASYFGLSVSGSASDDLADRGRAREPGLHAGRHARVAPDHLRLAFSYTLFRGKVREDEQYH
jgi:hypothetical protein